MHSDFFTSTIYLTRKDTFEHIAELMQLGLPEITEVVGSVIACALLSRLDCFLGLPIEHTKAEGQMWKAKFMFLAQGKDLMRQNDFLATAKPLLSFCTRQISEQLRDMYADVSESLIIPSPKSGVASISEDSTEESTQISLRKDVWLSSVEDDATCPAFMSWVVCAEAKQMHANPFDEALALRSLASFVKISREANLGGVVMPFVESLDIT